MAASKQTKKETELVELRTISEVGANPSQNDELFMVNTDISCAEARRGEAPTVTATLGPA